MGTDKNRTYIIEDESYNISVSHILGKFGYNVIMPVPGDRDKNIAPVPMLTRLMDVDLRGMDALKQRKKLKIKICYSFLILTREEVLIGR